MLFQGPAGPAFGDIELAPHKIDAGAAPCGAQKFPFAASELRVRMSHNLQFCCLVLDAILWIGFACIVGYYSTQQVYLSYDNFAIVTGTDDIMQWWFYMATPVAWALLCIRVLQNLRSDFLKWKSGEKFEIVVSMLGD